MQHQGSWRGKIGPIYYRHGNDPPASHTVLARRFPEFSASRLLILAWLIAWISTVPLFHIHIPDTSDRWSALQSGGVHTVLTPDLPGEYAPPSQDRLRESAAQIGVRATNSPELGFTLIGEQTKNVDALAILHSVTPFRAPPLLHSFALALVASRAPPRFVSA